MPTLSGWTVASICGRGGSDLESREPRTGGVMATDLTIHRGGLDPANVARVEEEAARLLRELADSLPRTDDLHYPADLLADALELRGGRRRFQERRAARRAALDRR